MPLQKCSITTSITTTLKHIKDNNRMLYQLIVFHTSRRIKLSSAANSTLSRCVCCDAFVALHAFGSRHRVSVLLYFPVIEVLRIGKSLHVPTGRAYAQTLSPRRVFEAKLLRRSRSTSVPDLSINTAGRFTLPHPAMRYTIVQSRTFTCPFLPSWRASSRLPMRHGAVPHCRLHVVRQASGRPLSLRGGMPIEQKIELEVQYNTGA